MSHFTPLMRAVVFDGPAPDSTRTRVAHVAVPEPRSGEVSIDVHYAGVNFKDVMSRRGDAGYVDSWPFVPGLAVSGVVRALGDGVEGFQVGDRVAACTGSGGLAEVCLAQGAHVVRVPRDFGMEKAAAAPGVLVTAELLLTDMGHLTTGETVLVHSAAGGVGGAVAQRARMAGVKMLIGTVGRSDRVAVAEELGYDRALVRRAELTAADIIAAAGGPLDLILDPQGTALLDLDLQVAGAGGRIVVFGNASGDVLDPAPPVGRLLRANALIAGFSLAALAATDPHRLARALHRVLDHLASGDLDRCRTGR